MEKCCFKDVIVIGNGPSGITLSYMLAGNWPFYNGKTHPIDFVQNRLETSREKSIMEQDLRSLSEGLEGRSSNPVSVLFDTLNHPSADLGEDNPSVLFWEKNPDRVVDHVVLGKAAVGGAWQISSLHCKKTVVFVPDNEILQKMNSDTLTVSLSSWMELPSANIHLWPDGSNRLPANQNCLKQKRATVRSVAKYYQQYVQCEMLKEYFIEHSVVTSVMKIPSVTKDGSTLWEVTGHFVNSCPEESKNFTYITPNVVLATGTSDQPNKLNVQGEDFPFVLYSLGEVEDLINRNELSSTSGSLMIVGAGLSAADAVITARFHGLSVVHVFRCSVHDPSLIFNKLPENVYPEYHKVHQMMQESSRYSSYKAFPLHKVQEIKANRNVILKPVSNQGPVSVVNVSHVLILIGMHSDLSFLHKECQNLGIYPSLPVDCKNNPIDINLYTHESVNHYGLYAVGPLVGDNFVRFVQGGCLAVASHIWKKHSRHVDHV